VIVTDIFSFTVTFSTVTVGTEFVGATSVGVEDFSLAPHSHRPKVL